MIYISGPMTGQPGYNFDAFNAAAATLREAGVEVVNPAELPEPFLAASWAECMREDIKALMDCSGILMLPGWEKSHGATLEHAIAHSVTIPIYLNVEAVLAAHQKSGIVQKELFA